MLSTLAFTLVLFAALGIFIYQIWGRFNLLRAAQPAAILNRFPERLQNMLVYAFGQKKFIRPEAGIVKEKTAGWMHFFIFWGFMVLGTQVITMFARAFIPGFYLPLLSPHLLGGPLLLIADLLNVVVVVCIGIAFTRWLVTKPNRLFGFEPAEARQRSHAHWEAYLILSCIALIMLGGLVYNAGRAIAHPTDPEVLSEIAWEPMSRILATLAVGIGPDTAMAASNLAWWVHNLCVLVLLNFLPLAKHFHVITSLPNSFFMKLEPKGAMSKMDLENATRYGTSRIDHFDWKQVLDMFSCTECGRCSSQCPATATGKPLAPRQMLLDLRDYLYEHQSEVIEKRIGWTPKTEGETPPEIGENVVGTVVSDEVLWSCNMCRACEESCPVLIEYVDKIGDMRRHLVQEEARFPNELNRVFKNMETQSNPWGIDAEKRFDWAEGLDVPTLETNPEPEYLYYVGCAGAFDDRNKKTTQAFARVLRKAGVNFACLAKHELCNGETARRLGNEYLYQTMAQMCVETLNGAPTRKVLVNCPHCFNTIKNELPQFGGQYEVIHAAEFVKGLIDGGKLKVERTFDKKTAYHDSCYYGRFNEVYDEPRDVLVKSGADVREMEKHRQFGTCCGAGGGRMWIEEDPNQRVNLMRTEQALKTGPEAIAVSCPFCMTMLSDGIKAKDLEESVQTLDVMEIVDRVTAKAP